MPWRGWLAALAVLVALPAVAAGTPDAATIAKRMKAALEPRRPSVRTITIDVSAEQGEATRWIAGQARKARGDGNAIVTVMLSPEGARGIALLVHEQPGADSAEWIYLPAVRRVRKLVPVQRHQSFMNTDFTYADFGFVTPSRSYRLRGTEVVDGRKTWKLEEVPHDQWYYSRILTWVAADDWLPVRREFYDPAGMLWKVEHDLESSVIDGVPTPLDVRVDEIPQGGSSELKVTGVRYDVDVPDDLFEPSHLPETIHSPLWAPPS
jgi:hypothetical protein